MLTIHPVDPYSVAVALNVTIDWPAVAFVGIDDDQMVGTGGLAWGGERCWLWFGIIGEPRPTYGIYVVRMAKKLLRKAAQLGEVEVFTVRDRSYTTSLKLLKFLNFTHHSSEKGEEIWVRSVI